MNGLKSMINLAICAALLFDLVNARLEARQGGPLLPTNAIANPGGPIAPASAETNPEGTIIPLEPPRPLEARQGGPIIPVELPENPGGVLEPVSRRNLNPGPGPVKLASSILLPILPTPTP